MVHASKNQKIVLDNQGSYLGMEKGCFIVKDKKGKSELVGEDFAEAFCAFYPSGSFARNWAVDNLTQFDLFLPNIFIRLPGSFSQDALTWKFTDRLFGGADYYTADKPNPDERSWVVQVAYETPLDEVYLMHQTAAVYLDIIKGIPIYAKGEGIRGYGTYAGRSTKTVLLDSIVDLDTLWARRYARDLELVLSTDSTYNHILSKAELYPAKLMPLRADAESLLAHASRRITTPELRDQLQEIEDNLPEDFKRVTEGIRKRAKFVNKKSQRWTADDFDDQSHALDDYQGKVILLDFWYRGCPWCIRAMPQIDQIADHYKDEPVVVLGINVDEKLEDALFVIEKLEPSYTNLKGRDLTKKYGIEAALTDEKTIKIVTDIINTGQEYKPTSDQFKYGIRSTPTMIINGRMVIGTLPYDQLRAIFQALVDEHERATGTRFLENWEPNR